MPKGISSASLEMRKFGLLERGQRVEHVAGKQRRLEVEQKVALLVRRLQHGLIQEVLVLLEALHVRLEVFIQHEDPLCGLSLWCGIEVLKLRVLPEADIVA